ncbi:MAG: putative sugar nucleotidyl transferase [Luteibaculum sp.]
MNLILFDSHIAKFYPLTLTRPVSDLRVGAYTIKEKWDRLGKDFKISTKTHDSLQEKYPLILENDNLLVRSEIIPDKGLLNEVSNLLHNQALVQEGKCIAIRAGAEKLRANPTFTQLEELIGEDTEKLEFENPLLELREVTDLFTQAEHFLKRDFKLMKGKPESDIGNGCRVTGKMLFLKKNAIVNSSIINTETGPVVIDKGAEVMEGCMLRGPLYIGEGAVLKMGTKVYGPTVIGPYCKVGGEISNSVLLGYSNKGHDGFLGNSIIGEWCNLGADTNTSNLKNNYGEVKRWSYESSSFEASGLQFCGLIMGDHSKSAINTQFNTGTTVGVFANVFSSSFPPKHIPSFSWMGDTSTEKFELDKAFEVAVRVMERRKVPFTDADKRLLEYLHSQSL